MFQFEFSTNLEREEEEGGEGAAGRQQLIIGLWSHGLHMTEVGELTFPNGDQEQYDIWSWLESCLLSEAGDPSALMISGHRST